MRRLPPWTDLSPINPLLNHPVHGPRPREPSRGHTPKPQPFTGDEKRHRKTSRVAFAREGHLLCFRFRFPLSSLSPLPRGQPTHRGLEEEEEVGEIPVGSAPESIRAKLEINKSKIFMEHATCDDVHEHAINVSHGETASTSTSHQDLHSDSDDSHQDDRPSTSTQTPSPQSSASTSPTAYNTRNLSFPRRDSMYGHGRSIWNSGLWISFELVIYVVQIVAAIFVLVFSRDEHPHAPLFAWIIGYTIGCIASIPLICWRCAHRNRPSEQEPEQPPAAYPNLTSSQSSEGRNQRSSGTVLHFGCITISCPRPSILAYHFKTAVDCFFAVWFVVGNVWIFGGHSTSSDSQEAPNMYRLCLAFLALSCVGYAIPFVMCAAICCCFPCLISLLRLQEDLGHTRGATQELINALPTYKFKPKRSKMWVDHASSSENLSEGGILGPGTKKERIVSAEDAVCCICLTKYGDDDELRELPCTHFFHVQCVDKWLKINAVCPLCKTEIGGVVRSFFGLPFGRRRVDRMAGREKTTNKHLRDDDD
uniref:RING-type domain-containing protein n=1 Tax=Oryza glumipatula TaxID=40148 RepID=A0A0E0B1D3_9ORYZ